jgi:hypothetical protein
MGSTQERSSEDLPDGTSGSTYSTEDTEIEQLRIRIVQLRQCTNTKANRNAVLAMRRQIRNLEIAKK